MHIKMRDAVQEEMILKYALNRIIIINEELDRDLILKVKYMIEKIIRLDNSKDIKPKDASPIEIRISSYGGEALSTMSLVSYIEKLKESGYIINTVCNGAAMSGGSKLLLAGSRRFADRYSSIMIHQPNSFSIGTQTLRDKELDYQQTKELWEMLKNYICNNSKITHEMLDKYVDQNRDWFLTPEEALELGVIDEII